MILIDTSVWIPYFRGNPTYVSKIRTLLEDQNIATVEWIFAELIQGALSKKEITFLTEYYTALPKLHISTIWLKASLFSQQHKLIHQGIGLIDAAIIVSALNHQKKIWSLDLKLTKFLTTFEPRLLYQPA